MEKEIIFFDLMREVFLGRSFFFFIGFGWYGLLEEIFKIVRYYMDVIGKRMSFEMCIVMGVIGVRIVMYMEVLKWKSGKKMLYGLF